MAAPSSSSRSGVPTGAMFPLRAEGPDEPSKSTWVGTGRQADWAGDSFWEERGRLAGTDVAGTRGCLGSWALFVQRPQKVFEVSGRVGLLFSRPWQGRVGRGDGTGERAFMREPWLTCGGRGWRGQRGPQAEVWEDSGELPEVGKAGAGAVGEGPTNIWALGRLLGSGDRWGSG